MPCSSAGMDEFYNLKEYGVHVSSETLATRVACEISKLIVAHNLTSELSEVARKWIKNHQAHDASTNNGG